MSSYVPLFQLSNLVMYDWYTPDRILMWNCKQRNKETVAFHLIIWNVAKFGLTRKEERNELCVATYILTNIQTCFPPVMYLYPRDAKTL